MWSMACSELKTFVARWPKNWLGWLCWFWAAGLLVLWQLGQVTLVQILTGLLVLAGLYWTSRRVLAAEDNVRVRRSQGGGRGPYHRPVYQSNCATGRYKMAIRLGGIYALERIAKDSEKDHGPIMEVFARQSRRAGRPTRPHALDAALYELVGANLAVQELNRAYAGLVLTRPASAPRDRV